MLAPLGDALPCFLDQSVRGVDLATIKVERNVYIEPFAADRTSARGERVRQMRLRSSGPSATRSMQHPCGRAALNVHRPRCALLSSNPSRNKSTMLIP